MVEILEPGKSPERLSSEKPFLLVGHTYQPFRKPFMPIAKEKLNIVSEVNEKIYQECYKPIFVDGSLPRGFAFSFYPGSREWMKEAHPEEYQRVVEKINAFPNKEYQVLGDPFAHNILPLQPKADQEMLIRMGRKAFEDDFGFTPKGMWLPETAVSKTTLEAVSDAGYKFVVLRDDQLQTKTTNPMRIQLGGEREIFIIHFNTGLNQSMSFTPERTVNGDAFLDSLPKSGLEPVVSASDSEFYGHHQENKDKFLKYIGAPGVLEQHGFTPFDIKTALQRDDIQTTDLWENSSWTCDDNLGRWRGDCSCHGTTEAIDADKRYLFRTLNDYGLEINSRLDVSDSGWREKFTEFILSSRGKLFGSEQEAPIMDSPLFWAKYLELMVGKTSCGWYFGDEDSPTRKLPRAAIAEIEQLVPDIREHTVFIRGQAAA